MVAREFKKPVRPANRMEVTESIWSLERQWRRAYDGTSLATPVDDELGIGGFSSESGTRRTEGLLVGCTRGKSWLALIPRCPA